MSDSLVSLVVALADDELILGHRHSEWTGFAPHIEEDVAFSSIAQDEIGHAAALYSFVGRLTGEDPDRLALGRAKDEYRNAILCERHNGDWAFSLARHWLYDNADDIRLETLADTSSDELRALVGKLRREERYHLIHANTWMRRVAHGPVEGHTRLVDAVGQALPEALDVFEPIELEDEAVKEGWLPSPFEVLRSRFMERTADALDELDIPAEISSRVDTGEFVASSSGDLIVDEEPAAAAEPLVGRISPGGRRGLHTDDFDQLWDDLTYTYRTNPGASW